MPNYNYLHGVYKERKIIHEAKAQGFIALRSAGSHSPVDVVVIDSEKHEILLVQCKPDSMSAKAKAKLEADHWKLNGEFKVTFRVL